MTRPFDAESVRDPEFRKTVRRRPFIYFPDTTANLAVREAMCHAVEELAIRHASAVTVTEFSSGHIRVEDDGHGWPNRPFRDSPSLIEFMMTHGHAGCRHAHVLEAVQKLVCLASIGGLNAICASMVVDSVHRGSRFRARYRFGRPTGPVQSLGRVKGDMLRFTFLLDARLLRRRPRLDRPALRKWWRALPLPIARDALILRRAAGRPAD